MKYFKVRAKCGHVGRNHYILKWFYVRAIDGKDAAKIVRNKPRVKHHHKDAIREVSEIQFEEFSRGIRAMNEDMYFKVDNSTDQRLLNVLDKETIYDEMGEIKYKKRRKGQYLKYQSILKECKKEIQGGNLYE